MITEINLAQYYLRRKEIEEAFGTGNDDAAAIKAAIDAKPDLGTTAQTAAKGNHTHSNYLTSHNPVDSTLSSDSTNAVENRAIYNALREKSNDGHTHNYIPNNADGSTTGTLTAKKFINSSNNNDKILLGNGNVIPQSTFAENNHNHNNLYPQLNQIQYLNGSYYVNEGIITDLYQTKIECKQGITETDYYNVNIDANNILVIVTLLDFNGNAVKNKDVTLTVDKGYFTQKGNKTGSSSADLTLVNDSKTITVNTGSYGNIIGLYTASEWGLCTFSANNTKIQINVTGWKLIDSTIGNVKLYNNGKYGAIVTDGINFTCNANSTNTFTSNNFEHIERKYLPEGACVYALNYHGCGFILRYDGQLTAYNMSSTNRSSVKMYGSSLFKTQEE